MPLHTACCRGHTDCARQLFERGAATNQPKCWAPEERWAPQRFAPRPWARTAPLGEHMSEHLGEHQRDPPASTASLAAASVAAYLPLSACLQPPSGPLCRLSLSASAASVAAASLRSPVQLRARRDPAL